MSQSYPRQRPPRNDLASAVITISVLVAAFLLLGIGCMWLGLQNGFGLAPTPTPTATAAPAVTPTPDSRATHVAEDMLTQVAYAATLVVQFTPLAQPPVPGDMPAGIGMTGTVTPSSPGPGELLPTVGPPVPPAAGVGEPAVTPLGSPPTALSSTVYIPSVTNAVPASDAVPQPLSPLPVIIPTPVVPVAPPPTPLPVIAPTPLPVITPTPPPPPSATPLPQPQVVVELAATIRPGDTQVRVGPSNVYTVTGVMPANSAVRLRGRTASGDWIYACCFGDKSFWVRRAYVNIANNSLPSGAPQGSDPNDSRWLPIQLPDPTLAPRPISYTHPTGRLSFGSLRHRQFGPCACSAAAAAGARLVRLQPGSSTLCLPRDRQRSQRTGFEP